MPHKLTEQQIEIIECCLADAGVEFLDILYEMTDHVANGLEEMESNDFAQNFRQYMAVHKKELMQDYGHFKRMATNRAWIAWAKTVTEPWTLPFAAIIVYICFYFCDATGADEIIDNLHLAFFAVYALVMFPTLINLFIYRAKYSVTSRLIAVPGIMLYATQGIRIERKTDNLWIIFIFYAVLLTLGITMGVAGFRLNRQYKLRYQL